MKVFVSVKFTDPAHPRILSIGMVAHDGCECYAELDLHGDAGQQHVAEATTFARTQVLSQWGRIGFGGIESKTFGYWTAGWLHSLIEFVREDIELVYTDKIEAALLEAALRGSGRRWSRIESRLRWTVATGSGGVTVVEGAGPTPLAPLLPVDRIGHHHALADARAMRDGFAATEYDKGLDLELRR